MLRALTLRELLRLSDPRRLAGQVMLPAVIAALLALIHADPAPGLRLARFFLCLAAAAAVLGSIEADRGNHLLGLMLKPRLAVLPVLVKVAAACASPVIFSLAASLAPWTAEAGAADPRDAAFLYAPLITAVIAAWVDCLGGAVPAFLASAAFAAAGFIPARSPAGGLLPGLAWGAADGIFSTRGGSIAMLIKVAWAGLNVSALAVLAPRLFREERDEKDPPL